MKKIALIWHNSPLICCGSISNSIFGLTAWQLCVELLLLSSYLVTYGKPSVLEQRAKYSEVSLKSICRGSVMVAASTFCTVCVPDDCCEICGQSSLVPHKLFSFLFSSVCWKCCGWWPEYAYPVMLGRVVCWWAWVFGEYFTFRES